MLTDAPAPPPSLRFRGHIDRLEEHKLFGWARVDGRDGAPAELEILWGDELLGIAVADQPRADLTSHGIGDCAFIFDLPAHAQADPGRLRVLFRGTGVPLRVPRSVADDPLLDRLAAVETVLTGLRDTVTHGQARQEKFLSSLVSTLVDRHNAATQAMERLTSNLEVIEARMALQGETALSRIFTALESQQAVIERQSRRLRLLLVLLVCGLFAFLGLGGLYLYLHVFPLVSGWW